MGLEEVSSEDVIVCLWHTGRGLLGGLGRGPQATRPSRAKEDIMVVSLVLHGGSFKEAAHCYPGSSWYCFICVKGKGSSKGADLCVMVSSIQYLARAVLAGCVVHVRQEMQSGAGQLIRGDAGSWQACA